MVGNSSDDCGLDFGELDGNTGDNENIEDYPKSIFKPFIGMEFDTIEESVEFWTKYGFNSGFSGRIKNTNRRQRDKVITSRTYVCTRAGHKYKDPRRVNSKPRPNTKCECGVLMSISLDDKGKYYVTNFVEDHNHDLEGRRTIHHLRGHRNINDMQARQIDVAKRAGLGPTMTHRYMAVEAGGVEKVGCTREDLKTHIRMLRSKKLELGEATYILEYFEQQSKQNPSFFHSTQLDSDGKITNFFWADSKMIADYEAFGDMISFDTTFGTNKESRSLGIFAGFNNHREMVVFGGALLYNETIKSFEWLFKIFLQCHGGKLPLIIFTDQDAAMKNALGQIMPNVRHALCSWHICQNALRKMQKVLHGNIDLFMTEFRRCMYDIDDIDNFEVSWRNMAEKFGVTDHKWIKKTYNVKHQWCITFFKDTFTAGARSTQLSECINGKLKKVLASGLSLDKFFIGFDLFLARVRDNESKSDCFSRQTFPHLANEFSPILKHAAETYSRNMFNLFQKEFQLETVVHLDKYDPIDHPHVRVAKVANKSYNIFFDPMSMTISCTCGLFEMWGYLCAHILKVFILCGVDKIPEKYVLKRWTLNAKSYPNEVVNPLPKLSIAQKADLLSADLRRILHRAPDDELFEGVRHIINTSAHSFIDKYQMLTAKGKDCVNPTTAKSINTEVTGLKKKDNCKNGGKRRTVACTEGAPSAKRVRARQQKKLKSQPVANVTSSLSQVIQEVFDGNDDLLRLTLG